MTDCFVADTHIISARVEDQDGRLFVGPSVITKATIDGYRGSDLGGAAAGFDDAKTYRMLRHPVELAKAAASLRGQPLMSSHAMVSAADHRGDITIGSVGDGVFDEADGTIRASLAIWQQPFIDRIKSGAQREISMGYRFRPDMTPGNWNGAAYDGVMRDIRPNHVALVQAGRVNTSGVGPMAAVADSAEESDSMSDQDETATKEVEAKKKAEPEAKEREEAKSAAEKKRDDESKAKAEDERKVAEAEAQDEARALDAAAMEARITENVRAQFRAAREAEQDVTPIVGNLSVAMDSAEDVYAAALRLKGVALDGVPREGLKPMWQAMKPAFARPVAGAAAAMDSAALAARASAAERFGVSRLKSVS